jgi:hypothetical protein
MAFFWFICCAWHHLPLWLHFDTIPQTTVNHRVDPRFRIKIVRKAQRNGARFIQDFQIIGSQLNSG